MHDTIAAIATPPGEGAIALLRISGPKALAVADKVFKGRTTATEAPPRTAVRGRIVEKDKTIDDILLTVFRAPASYTGEDVVELSCHGGVWITARILQLLLSAGARAAEPGEFTQRAFLNGKMDLTQAEAVMDTIRAQSTLALEAATAQREGRLGKAMEMLREDLLTALAHLEAYIDFPEEGIDPETREALCKRLGAARDRVNRLLATAEDGRILREGVRTAICGAPNAGKSSLLNRLLRCERAIVHEMPGTTRDTIEELAVIRGLPFRLTDTAGIRETDNPVEKEGVLRAQEVISKSDLALHVVDLQSYQPPIEPVHPREILVLNKCDQVPPPSPLPENAICISCATGEGIEELIDRLTKMFEPGAAMRAESGVAINARHQHCLNLAGESLGAAIKTLKAGMPPEIVSIELREAAQSIGEVVGFTDAEELLGRIFGMFCIGK